MMWKTAMSCLLILLAFATTTVGAAEKPSAGFESKVAEMKKRLSADPANRKAWVLLGNLYFDADQPKQAVEAYQKALELKSDDPNVLCDQGIMLGRLGESAKAIENFEKALAINPKHGQSLYNAGIVANEQLHQPSRALYYWKRLVEADPASPAAATIKGFIDRLSQDLETLKSGRPVAAETKPADMKK